jgi:DNA-binding SARP family transcriptional activator
MSRLTVHLFGKLSVRWNDEGLDGLGTSKVQELLCYLLLHRNRPHPREALACLLWGEIPTAHAKKYLRQALWQLQAALRCHAQVTAEQTFLVDADWVQLNVNGGLWLDVADLERAAAVGQGVPGDQLDGVAVKTLQDAVDLYRGDLLEGWYQDWCVRERERLRETYLGVLDKLMQHCELRPLYETGLHYGALSLQCDRGRECTHQYLMRLHSAAGDRAAALRQYDRCIIALDEELGVKPSDATVALYERIRGGHETMGAVTGANPKPKLNGNATLSGALGRLTRIEAALVEIQRQVRHEIELVEGAMIAAEGNGRWGLVSAKRR